MTVLSTVRSTLFIAACFLAFALAACDSPPAQKQQSQSNVVSKKITMNKTETPEKKDSQSSQKTTKKEADLKKAAASLKDKKKEKETKPAAGPDKTEKPELEEKIQASRSEPAYSAAGKINPFLPLIKTGIPEKEKKKKPERQLTPLEKLDLSQLELVAIVKVLGGGEDFAMVQEAGGKGYIVRKGTYIGRNRGMVTRIENDKIIIKESFADFKGEKKSRKKEMKLHKQDNKE